MGVTVATLATGRHPFVDPRNLHGSNERIWALAEVLHYTSDDPLECRRATVAALEASLADCDALLRDFVHGCTWRGDSIDALMKHPFVMSHCVEPVRKYVTQLTAPI